MGTIGEGVEKLEDIHLVEGGGMQNGDASLESSLGNSSER